MKQYRINELMLYREYEQEEDQILQDLGEIINSLEEAVERAITECIKEGILTKSSKNSPTSSGSEMNCKRNLNGSGGRREIGIPR